MDDDYALYRHFDIAGRLLYVGISGELATRDASHIARSRWMRLMASSAVERYGTLEEVEDAERAAIQAEHPLFNVRHNDTPEAKERLRGYLEEIGRLDLLSARPAGDPGTSDASVALSPPSPPPWPRGVADVHGQPYTPEPRPISRITADGRRFEIRHNRGVTLQISGKALHISLHLDAGLALELAEALTRHAEEDFAQHGIPPGHGSAALSVATATVPQRRETVACMTSFSYGDRVTAMDAAGAPLPKRALGGVVDGDRFPVIWVCREEEWEAAAHEGRDPDGVPWPAEDVHPARPT